MNQPSRRDIAVPALAASAAMLLWMARPLLSGQISFTGDLLHFHYPLRDFYARALATGQHVEWMPSLLGGFDVGAEGQLGAFHPWHWLLYRLLPLDVAFNVEMLAPYPALFAGMWVFLRPWCGSPAALFGAMLFSSSGFALQHGVHVNMISVIAHLPWLLAAVHVAFTTASSSRRTLMCAAIAALTGSQVLLGHPQAVWLSAVIEAAYVLFLLGGGVLVRVERLRGTVAVVSGKVLGALLGAIQLLGTLEAVRHSTRPTDAAFATLYSLPPIQLWQLLDPYLFWGQVLRWTEASPAGDEFGAYGGAIALTLSAWWVATRLRTRKTSARAPVDALGLWALACGIVALWLSTGSHGGLYYLQTWLPIVGQFRAPVRYVLLSDLALAIMSALALGSLMRADGRDGERAPVVVPWVLVALSTVSTLWLVLVRDVSPLTTVEARIAGVLGPLLFLIAALLLTAAVRGSRAALICLVVAAGADQALYGLGGMVVWHDFVTRAEAVGYLGAPESRPPVAPNRIVCCPFPDLFELAGYRSLDGYVGLTPVRSLNYRSAQALRVADVRYANALFLKETSIEGVRRLSDDWYELAAPLPRARLVTEARTSSDPGTDLGRIDVDRAALVARTLALDSGAPGQASIVRDDPGRIDVRTQSPGRQLLVVSESFDDGWTVTIDGTPAAVERVNGDFFGAVVPSGDHLVAFDFRPQYRARGGAVSLGALAVVIALAVFGARGDSRRRSHVAGA